MMAMNIYVIELNPIALNVQDVGIQKNIYKLGLAVTTAR
jgi:hypothetical protein